MLKMKKVSVLIMAVLVIVSGAVFAGNRTNQNLDDESAYKSQDELTDLEYDDEGFTFKDELTYLEEIGAELTEEEKSELEGYFNEAIELENEEKYEESDEIWDLYYGLLESKYDFDEGFTFEDELTYLEEIGAELTEEETVKLENLFNEAIELENDEKCEEAEKLWDEYYEILGEFEDYEEAPIELSAVYNIKNDKLVLSVNPEDYEEGKSPKELSMEKKVLHQKLWDRASKIIPTEYMKYFRKLEIGTDGEDGILASVVELEDLSKWSMFLDIEDSLNDENAFIKEFDFTVVHEFAHVLTLNNTQLGNEDSDGTTYETYEGVSYRDSYINKFYDMFWKDAEGTEEDAYDRYDQSPESYVSDYAATNIEEDMAESFATFVLEAKRTGVALADKKVNFFYDFEELVDVRDSIRTNLDIKK